MKISRTASASLIIAMQFAAAAAFAGGGSTGDGFVGKSTTIRCKDLDGGRYADTLDLDKRENGRIVMYAKLSTLKYPYDTSSTLVQEDTGTLVFSKLHNTEEQSVSIKFDFANETALVIVSDATSQQQPLELKCSASRKTSDQVVVVPVQRALEHMTNIWE